MHRSGFYRPTRKSKGRFFFTVLLLFSIIHSTQLRAQGNLLVMPRRVIFEGAMKSQELNIANIGTDTARYSISLIEIRMKRDGNFEVISTPDSGQNFADKYIRFFPRNVTLAPNESQVVKMQVSRSNAMQPGEYRSHIYFRAIPHEKSREQANAASDSSISISLVPVFGISIPVIIRVGETAAQVSLTDISFELARDSTPRLNLLFERKGNRSVYGDFMVNLISPQGKKVQVGLVKGIAVYTPNESRQVKIDLDKGHDINYHSGKLQLVYSAPAEAKYVKFAEAEVLLK